MRRNSLSSTGGNDASKWKENYTNLQQISQQQKHELSMLKIESQSYQRRNESLSKQINCLKQQLQNNENSHFMISSPTPKIIHKNVIVSPKPSQIEQKQSRKIANLQFDIEQLTKENNKLKENNSEQRQQMIIFQSQIHVLQHENKESEIENK
eukprot:37823_1